MSTLAGRTIRRRLNTGEPDEIVVTPILNEDTQLNPIGIDCRLGNQFIVFNTQAIGTFDARSLSVQEGQAWYDEVVVPFHTPLVLHPHAMVLASTFEFIGLPNDIEASIEGRSSWARVGLMIATAVYVEPGFKGCVTLELSNTAPVPLNLYPGTRIGQLIFRDVSTSVDYQSEKYVFPIGPEVSKLDQDPENRFLEGQTDRSGKM